jgi:hypothetical protein
MPTKTLDKFLSAAITLTIFSLGALASSHAASQISADTGINSNNNKTVSYGSYQQPFSKNSLWNARPVKPVFGTFVIPKSKYFPSIASGAYSTGIFLASATDRPMTVVGRGSTESAPVGVADPDFGARRMITIPRWPADVLPASGSDGHADIVDPVTKTIHSFWQLKRVNGQWTAALYSWSDLTGPGWGDPAHYYQGARAVGIPASAGLVRKHEVKDGRPVYGHALAMSLTFNALSNGITGPSYVFPATSADNTPLTNTGMIPEGALMMLPPSFDSSKIMNADLRKIADTLKTYGAYVVDRNEGTPYVIYVENGSGFNLMPKGWDNTIANQLDQIRAELRQVVSAEDWLDANGNSIAEVINAQKKSNILSMRGSWSKQSGTASAFYDTAAQSLLFTATQTKSVYVNANNTGLTHVSWALPKPGVKVRFKVQATGGAKLRLQVRTNDRLVYESRDLADGQSQSFQWPDKPALTLIATSGTRGASSVKGELSTNQ